MERIFRVNGKEFTNEKDAADYEAVVKKEQEERAKAVAKAEAERKAKEEAKDKAKKRVDDIVAMLNEAMKMYDDAGGEKLEYVNHNGQLATRKISNRNHTSTVYLPWFPNW